MPEPARLHRVPLHAQVADLLRDEIHAEHAPGARLDSEAKLAKRFSVSVPTLREALSTLAREGLLERRHGSGTYVADRGRGKHVAVVTELALAHPQTSPFYLHVTQHLRAYFEQRGIPVRVYVGHVAAGEQEPVETTCPEFLHDIRQQSIRGLAVVGASPLAQWFAPLREQGIPMVGGTPEYPLHVQLDYDGLVREGVRLLAARDRRRVAVMGSGWHETVLHEAMTDADLPVHEAWICRGMHPADPRAGARAFAEIWEAREEQPDGLIVTDDMLGQSAAMAILKYGIRVPDDLLVVSHANRGSSVPHLFPVILLEGDPQAYAEAMGGLLVQRLQGEEQTEPRAVLGFQRREEEAVWPPRAEEPAQVAQRV